MNTFHQVLFFISAMTLTAGDRSRWPFQSGPISQVQRQVKLRGRELLAYFGKGRYDFGIGIPSLSAIRTNSEPVTRPATIIDSPETSPNVRTEHRLEAYAKLLRRVGRACARRLRNWQGRCFTSRYESNKLHWQHHLGSCGNRCLNSSRLSGEAMSQRRLPTPNRKRVLFSAASRLCLLLGSQDGMD